jgi:phage FluMu protein gp41
MLLTNTTRGSRHRNSAVSVCSWVVTPNPGPEVRGPPSFWYFADPIPFSRQANDPGGFDKLEQALRELRISDRVVHEAVVAAARVCMRTGKKSPTLIIADDLTYFDTALRETDRQPRAGHEALWRALHTTGQISGPTSLKAVHMRGQLSVEQLVDRYGLRCTPIRT